MASICGLWAFGASTDTHHRLVSEIDVWMHNQLRPAVLVASRQFIHKYWFVGMPSATIGNWGSTPVAERRRNHVDKNGCFRPCLQSFGLTSLGVTPAPRSVRKWCKLRLNAESELHRPKDYGLLNTTALTPQIHTTHPHVIRSCVMNLTGSYCS